MNTTKSGAWRSTSRRNTAGSFCSSAPTWTRSLRRGASAFRADRAVRYRRDSVGMELNYRVVSETVARVCRHEKIDAGWCAPIEADVEERGE